MRTWFSTQQELSVVTVDPVTLPVPWSTARRSLDEVDVEASNCAQNALLNKRGSLNRLTFTPWGASSSQR